MEGGWKKVAYTLTDSLLKEGAALVPDPLKPLSKDPDAYEELHGTPTLSKEGRGLNRKEVQRWLWENRQFGRAADCLWGIYDEETDRTVVGFGRLQSEVPQEK